MNEDADLSRKLERTLKLSVLNEQIAVKAHAQTLKSQNTLDVDVESFVVKASERLQETRFLTVEQGHLKLGNAGVIKQ